MLFRGIAWVQMPCRTFAVVVQRCAETTTSVTAALSYPQQWILTCRHSYQAACVGLHLFYMPEARIRRPCQ